MKHNGRYRFRTINTVGVSQCPIELRVQDHYLMIISIDGHAIESKPVDVVQIEPGLIIFNSRVHGILWLL